MFKSIKEYLINEYIEMKPILKLLFPIACGIVLGVTIASLMNLVNIYYVNGITGVLLTITIILLNLTVYTWLFIDLYLRSEHNDKYL